MGVVVITGGTIPLQSAYCGAKATIRGFTDAVRCELLHQQSTVRLTWFSYSLLIRRSMTGRVTNCHSRFARSQLSTSQTLRRRLYLPPRIAVIVKYG